MKLYNIYQNLILEEIFDKIQLTEAVSIEDIDKILAGDENKPGKFYYVSFDYPDKNGVVRRRWGQIFQRNISNIGNNLIDMYQVSMDGVETEPTNSRGSNTGWKKFDLSKINNLKVSKVPYFEEPKPYVVTNSKGETRIAKLNKNGNDSYNIAATPTISKIGSYSYAPSTIKSKERAKQVQPSQTQVQPSQTQVQPSQTQAPSPQPTAARQPVRPMRRIQPKPVEPEVEPEEDEENNLELNK